MRKQVQANKKSIIISLVISLLLCMYCHAVLASPFGTGKFGANVPFGSQTSLTIATDGNVSIPVTPTPSGTLATGTSTVTVTSTDVVGYKLYIRANSNTSLNNGGSNITASSNVSPAALSVNTWGYNTDASTNFAGITLSDVLIRTGTGPYSSGDITTVTYGLKIDDSLPAGNYSSTIVYTAVPQTQ
ncbi:MAG TPA: hypothetical protein VLF90_00405 [Patescibacteria group bacterium]|nr:hypothetical protein [Patescibacteria group bacterium]